MRKLKMDKQYKYRGIHTVIGLLFLVTLFSSCNAYNSIQTDYDRSQDFEAYKTFAWLDDLNIAGDSEFDNDFVRQKTKNYFAHCFKQRDMHLDTINPELLLQVRWLSEPKEITLTGSSNFPEYYDPFYYQESPSLRFNGRDFDASYQHDSQDYHVEYVHGGVILSVIDRNTTKEIWKGVAEGDLYDPHIMYRDLHPAIHKLMRKFPKKIQNI